MGAEKYYQIMRVNYPRSESASDLPKQSLKQAQRDKADLRRLTACQNKPNTFNKTSTDECESSNAPRSITKKCIKVINYDLENHQEQKQKLY